MAANIDFKRPCPGELMTISVSNTNRNRHADIELWSGGVNVRIEAPYGCDYAKAVKVVEALRDFYAMPVVSDCDFADMRSIKMLDPVTEGGR